MIWSIIHLADILLWLFTAGSVAYVVLFALASGVKRKVERGKWREESGERTTFLVLFPAYAEDRVIVNSVEAFLRQDYPQELYEVAVISDHMSADTNQRLAALPITLLQPTFEKSSKAKALQYAMKVQGARSKEQGARGREQGARDKEQGARDKEQVVILDADNVVAPDFLSRLDQACRQGYEVIQCHRTAKNDDNDIAVLDGVSEEINNTLFRRAHNNIGLSAALIGSGMCFSQEWFKDHVEQLSSAVEDRELEVMLAIENVYVRYEEDIRVMDEKVSSQDVFQRQRLRWMTGQLQTLLLMLPHVPQALLQRNMNYIDKTVQQMLIPRSILLVLLPLMALLMTLLAPTWSLKWWAMLASFAIALYVAIPAQLRTRAIFGRLRKLPRLVWRMMQNIAHIDKNNTDFIHTTHTK